MERKSFIDLNHFRMFFVVLLYPICQMGARQLGLIGMKRHGSDTFHLQFLYFAERVCYNAHIFLHRKVKDR